MVLEYIQRINYIIIFVLLIVITAALANPDAKRLYDDLLSTYNRLIRPVSNNTDTVLVKLGLRLSQLIDLVSAKQSKRTIKFLRAFLLILIKTKMEIKLLIQQQSLHKM